MTRDGRSKHHDKRSKNGAGKVPEMKSSNGTAPTNRTLAGASGAQALAAKPG